MCSDTLPIRFDRRGTLLPAPDPVRRHREAITEAVATQPRRRRHTTDDDDGCAPEPTASSGPRSPPPVRSGIAATRRGIPRAVIERTDPASERGVGALPFVDTVDDVLAGGLLSVAFQPIVDLAGLRVFACEALVRCSSRAFPCAESFIEAAVASRRIGEVGREVRRLAVAACPHLRLFVNVHPAEFDEPWLARTDDPIFAHAPGVVLEITEGAPLDRFPLHGAILREVRARGVRLAVDDLGTGYSNLKAVADLAPEIIKIDRRLLSGLASVPRLRRLVRAVVTLCGEMGALCVAEGIETPAELTAVMAAGVHFGQGYLLARPACAPPPAGQVAPFAGWRPLEAAWGRRHR